MDKKLLVMGGSNVLIPIIKCAQKMGIYVITCDYLPDNWAHKHSDEYVNISTLDKEAVLEMAKQKRIDGIISFACDAGVVTAAYVAEKMGLPFQCSYEAATILQDKGRFRQFLTENGFNCPHAKKYNNIEDVFNDIDFFTWPVIVKPTDSAGSKGVTKVDNVEDLRDAIQKALEVAHNGCFIVEDFLTFEGYHSSTDPFTVDGKLVFSVFSDQLFDEDAKNPYIPSYIIFPSSMESSYQQHLTEDIQRLVTLLDMKTGIYNIETCVANGKPYIMEVSPRGGGCKIAEVQKLAYGIDFIENEIRKALGMPLLEINNKECDGVWCELVVHDKKGRHGILKQIVIDKKVEEKYVKVNAISAKPGSRVGEFTSGGMALGDIILRCDDRKELDYLIQHVDEWLHIEVDEVNSR